MRGNHGFIMTYNVYCGLNVGAISFVCIFVISLVLGLFISSWYWFLLILYLVPFVGSYIIKEESPMCMPDIFHINSKNKYTFYDNMIYIKKMILLFPVWVCTDYQEISLEEFVNKKIALHAQNVSNGVNDEVSV